jgi:PKHD-type hydroxylase
MLNFYPTFPVNSEINQTDFYWYKNQFTSEEIDLIFETSKLYEEVKGLTGSNSHNSESKNIRNSTIRWLPPTNETEWIYDKLMKLIVAANYDIWQFDLSHIRDSIQYTEYTAGEDENSHGKYDWHLDVGPFPVNNRKISITVQLSDPSEYEGGQLELWNDTTPSLCPSGKGNVILFPSYLLHRVTPITKGTRKSLVLWVGGRPFK